MFVISSPKKKKFNTFHQQISIVFFFLLMLEFECPTFGCFAVVVVAVVVVFVVVDVDISN